MLCFIKTLLLVAQLKNVSHFDYAQCDNDYATNDKYVVI